MIRKSLYAVGIAVACLQIAIASGLLVIAYSDSFGVLRIAENGEKIVAQLAALQERQGAATPGSAQLRSMMQTNYLAFRKIGQLIAWVAGAIMLTAVVQLVVLVTLRRGGAAGSDG
jgi:hypothetical protein